MAASTIAAALQQPQALFILLILALLLIVLGKAHDIHLVKASVSVASSRM